MLIKGFKNKETGEVIQYDYSSLGNLPTTLPSVSTEDNGKFARVVDGEWTAVIIENAEGVTFG